VEFAGEKKTYKRCNFEQKASEPGYTFIYQTRLFSLSFIKRACLFSAPEIPITDRTPFTKNKPFA